MRTQNRILTGIVALVAVGFAGVPVARAVDGPGSSPQYLTAFKGLVYFSASDGSQISLWSSDGTANHTSIVDAGIAPAELARTGPCTPDNFTQPLPCLFFSAYDGTNGRELWVSQGSLDDTQMVTNSTPGPESTQISNITAVGNRVFYQVRDPTLGVEPWVSDGTQAGTHLLKNIAPGADSSFAGGWTRLGTRILFVATDVTHGFELWETNGTTAGTHLLRDIQPGPQGSGPFGSTVSSKHVLFTADDGAHGTELWSTDGTTAGTHLVRDIMPGTGGSAVLTFGGFHELGGLLYFAANDGCTTPSSGGPMEPRRAPSWRWTCGAARGGASLAVSWTRVRECSSRPRTSATVSSCGGRTARPPEPRSSRTSGRA